MKKIFNLTIVILLLSICKGNILNAHRIEYGFGKGSDVIDSIKFVVSWYKKQYNQPDVKKLNLYAGINYCDEHLNIFISQYPILKGNGILKLAKATNRIIRLDKDFYLPVLFDTDILSNQIEPEKITSINMGGYHIRIDKNEKYVWKVTKMQITF